MQKFTKEQAIVITGFTGILCGSFSDFHADVEKRLSRCIFTHEMGGDEMSITIKALYKDDFIEMATIGE